MCRRCFADVENDPCIREEIACLGAFRTCGIGRSVVQKLQMLGQLRPSFARARTRTPAYRVGWLEHLQHLQMGRIGFRQPVVVDEEGVIIVGHTRYKAALKLGLEMMPVHVAVGLTPAQAKAYRIADNQTAPLSQWDNDKLPLELAQLQEMEFDLNLTGFSSDELLRLLGSETNEGMADPDAVPEPPDEPITQPGDL